MEAVERLLFEFPVLYLLSDEALWQQRIYERLPEEGPDRLQASVQTVGRRVDALYEQYLETCIVPGENVNRDLLSGYTTTEQNVEILEQHHICRDCDEVRPEWELHAFVDVETYFEEA